MPIKRVTALQRGARKPRRAQGRRVEKSVHVEEKEVVSVTEARTTNATLP
jgi:hypothetical protein